MTYITEKVTGIDKLWQHTKGAQQIRVAVLDGLVDTNHSCFVDTKIKNISAISNTKSTNEFTQHGTHIASIIFGNHNSFIQGIAPNCTGIFIPIFGQTEDGTIRPCSQLDLARAIEQAIGAGAHIINISGGQLSNTGEADGFLLNAIKACEDNNVLLIAAAGNDGCDCLHVPAAIASTLAIGSMDDHGEPLPHSNWGKNYINNGLLAPGQNILGAIPNEQFKHLSGTSFATPIVSGVAALLLSLQLEQGQTPDPNKVRTALLTSATPCKSNNHGEAECRRFLAGTLDVPAALQHILNGEETKMSNENNETQVEQANIEPAIVASMIDEQPQTNPNAYEATNISPEILTKNEQTNNSQVSPSEAQIEASECACSGGSSSLVFALGKVGFDYGSEARRDAFHQAMPANKNNPDDPQQLLDYLKDNPYEAQSIIWTLNLDSTSVYAITPNGAYANVVFERLRDALQNQINGDADMVSIPGITGSSISLLNGQSVPLIVPNPRGMYSWATQDIIKSSLGDYPTKDGKAKDDYDAKANGLYSFLNRIYYDLRNLGTSAHDRALNYSATNAFQASQVITSATELRLELDSIDVKKSPICRPGSECYDVELVFFNPDNLQNANKVHRYTVDVSDVIPVTIGEIRSWSRK